MPRKRDNGTEEAIINAAWELFGRKGYNATSYSDIAKLSGIPRANVQTYFPKKGYIAARILEVLRNESVRAAKDNFPNMPTLFEQHCLHGQIYIQTIMGDERLRRFFCDLLEDRKLMNELIETDYMWSAGFVKSAFDGATVPEENLQDIQVDMGGLYELMYHCIKAETNFDIWKRLTPGYRDFASFIGIDAKQSERLIKDSYIKPPKLGELGRTVLAAVEAVLGGGADCPVA